MSKVAIELTSDGQKAVKDLAKYNQELEKTAKAGGKATKETEKAYKANQRLARLEKKVHQDVLTPMGRHKAMLRDLNTLRKQGSITVKEYDRSVRQLNQSQRQGSTGVLSSLTNMAAGYLSVATAVRVVTASVEKLRQTRQEAAEREKGARGGVGSLAQLANTPEEMKALLRATDATFGEGGFETRDEAARFIFSLKSAGGMQHRKLFSDLARRGVIDDPALMARGGSMMEGAFGTAETGGMRALVSKAFAATIHAPDQADELLEAAAKSGASAGLMGMRDEDVLAATGVLAKIKGADAGGTYLSQMMRTLKAKGVFQGKSLDESLSMVAKVQRSDVLDEMAGQAANQGKTRAQLAAELDAGGGVTAAMQKKWWGRAQGQEAYELLLKNRGLYRDVLGGIDRAQAGDLVSTKLGLGDVDPGLKVAERLAREKSLEELTTRRMAVMTMIADAITKSQRRTARETGGWEVTSNVGEWVNQQVRGYAGDEFFIEHAGGASQPLMDLYREMKNLDFSDLYAASERLDSAAASLENASGGPTMAPTQEQGGQF